MRPPKLAGVDTNLLVALHALLVEKSVARASRRLGLSPSATSHALARLRDVLHDEVLVPAGRSMVLTPRAQALLPLVEEVVRGLEQVFAAPQALAPSDIKRSFALGVTDHVELLVLERALARLAKEAPQIALSSRPAGAQTVEQLRSGELDFAFWGAPSVPTDLSAAELFADPFVTIVRRAHPLTRGRLTAERFAACSHILVSPSGLRDTPVDRALTRLGLERHIALTVSNFMPVAFLVAQSELVATLSSRLAARMMPLVRIVSLTPPLALPVPLIRLVWHKSLDGDAAHRWVRDALTAAARALA